MRPASTGGVRAFQGRRTSRAVSARSAKNVARTNDESQDDVLENPGHRRGDRLIAHVVPGRQSSAQGSRTQVRVPPRRIFENFARKMLHPRHDALCANGEISPTTPVGAT